MYAADDNPIELPDDYDGDPVALPGPATFAPAVEPPRAPGRGPAFPLAGQPSTAGDAPFVCNHWPRRRRSGPGFGSSPRRSRVRPRPSPSAITLTPKVRPGRRPRGNRFGGFTFGDRIACVSGQHGGRPPAHLAIWEAARAARDELLPLAARRGRPSDGWVEELVARATGMLAGHLDTINVLNAQITRRVRGAVVAAGRTYQPARARDEAWYGQEDVDRSRNILQGRAIGDSQRIGRLHAQANRRGRARLDRGQFLAALTVAHVVGAKSVLRNRDGSIPQCWIADRLRAYGFPGDDERLQRLAAALLAVLQELGLLVCTDVRYAPGRARRFALAGATFSLPFVGRCVERRRRRAEATALVRTYERHLALRAAAERIASQPQVAHSKSLSHYPSAHHPVVPVLLWPSMLHTSEPASPSLIGPAALENVA